MDQWPVNWLITNLREFESPPRNLLMDFPIKRFKTIYADPPWYEIGGGKICRGAQGHYPIMKTKDIMALPVPSICQENSHLYLWVTNNFLQDGLAVMNAWGNALDHVDGAEVENEIKAPVTDAPLFPY